MNNEEILKRLEAMESWKRSLESSGTIPLIIDNSLKNRGFLKTDYFVAGKGTLSGTGEYSLVIPNADRTSTVLVTSHTGNTGSVLAEIIPIDNSYGIYALGTATDTFDFVVILTKNLYAEL